MASPPADPPPSPAGELGEALLAERKLEPEALERARRLQRETGERLHDVLIRLGLVPERDIAATLARRLSLTLLGRADFPGEAVLGAAISPRFLRHVKIVPIATTAETLRLAMADPFDEDSVAAIAYATDRAVERCLAAASDIEAALERLYGAAVAARAEPAEVSTDDDIDRIMDLASDAPVIRIVNDTISRAIEARASDIHFEPTDQALRIRLRVDGVLQDLEPPPARLRAAIVSRIKVMAKLNIAQRRLAQDGRIRLPVRGQEVDLRVSTAPTIHGESVVLRILDRGSVALDFDALGFDAETLARYLPVLEQPHGILLVTGPTGSGKTTTLYTSLLTLNTPDRKILTIEDPVEYQLAGITQTQTHPEIGLTFAGALRFFLRHDPNILMVGEIRDLETAQIAIQAALVGRMILSTLHTNDAASAVTRLLDMGVEDYLITATVNAIVGQRLVRTLCRHCRSEFAPAAEMLSKLQIEAIAGPGATLHRAVGCAECGGTGYHGRTTILELLIVSEAIRPLILRRADAREIQRVAVAEGMRTMFADGMGKALAGQTTIEEVLRVTREA